MQYCKDTGLFKTIEIVGDDPGLDSLNYEFWAQHGDHRHSRCAIRVITYSNGEVFTHFARKYSPRELAAIAEFEREHDC